MIDSQFQRQLGRMEELIHALDEAADSPICRQARELVQIVLKMHADALERVLNSIHDDPMTGQSFGPTRPASTRFGDASAPRA